MDNWTVTGRIKVTGAMADLCRCEWPKPFEFTRTSENVVLTLALSPLPDLRRCNLPYPSSRDWYEFGRLFVMPAGIRYQTQNDGGRHRFLRLRVDPSHFQELSGLENDWNMKTGFAVSDPRVESALLRLVQEIASPGFSSGTLADALSMTAIVDVGRMLVGAHKKETREHGKLSSHQIRKISDYVESAEGTTPTTTEIADLIGVSRGHLSRIFKQTTGHTLHDYITQIRASQAISLLCGTDLPMKVIAHKVGFGSRYGFHKAFYAATGRPPGWFRQKLSRRS